ncbi:Seed linoleate 9S-lipoxygenase [Glycine soja]
MKDSNSERPGKVYVPRDENFGDFLIYGIKSLSRKVLPVLKSVFDIKFTPNEFDIFEEVQLSCLQKYSAKLVPYLCSRKSSVLMVKSMSSQFSIPHLIKVNKSAWMTDEEFAREMIAGVNPCVIRLLQEFPPQSKLDPSVYGDQTSKLTEEHLEINLEGLMVDKAMMDAIEGQRLFILDHHDVFMPFLTRLNESKSTKAYATRTILFLKDDGTLKPLAIELSLPYSGGQQLGADSRVILPANQGVESTIWLLAKAYVVVNDSCYHQLISHWSERGKYAMEISSAAYKNWVFPDQALPTDLIKRGMAIKDSSSPNGLRLVIEDYPYAVDGLEIWNAIKTWVHDYVSLYYATDDAIEEDHELQAWWKEVVEKGHGDLKDEPWRPKLLHTREELIQSCRTIIWIASALHAAVNFGQYPYGGFILNRPTLSRRLIPEKGTAEYDEMVNSHQKAYLKTITPNLSVIEILSRHASDEFYLGQRDNPNWTPNPRAIEAFKKFGNKLAEIETKISERNHDPNLRNRTGPAKLPYTHHQEEVAKMLGLFDKSHKIKGTVVLMPKNVLDVNELNSVRSGGVGGVVSGLFGAVADVTGQVVDTATAILSRNVSFKLISATSTDAKGNGKVGKETYLEKHLPTLPTLGDRRDAYGIHFEWDANFGIPGAIYIRNYTYDEFFLVSVTLEDIPNQGTIHFVCNSWVYNFKDYDKKDRIFFANKTYLPSATPGPLVKYREEELEILRGNGTGERKEHERIYDYDVYNDLGNPDKDVKLARPVLGGSSTYPYPRRVRTGRKATKKDPKSERPASELYMPRDEKFGHLKSSDFLTYGIKSLSQTLLPSLENIFDSDLTWNEFDSFEEVRDLYEGGIKVPTDVLSDISPIPVFKEIFRSDGESVLQFPPPHVVQVSKSAWMTDDEFAREMIAGVNPNVIRLLKEIPPQSKLDPTLYGDQSSTISKEHLEINMGGVTVEEALNGQRLFILDYHDAFMPYLTRINALPTAKAYATRTILFLKDDGTLKPLAIELSKPHPSGDNLGAESKVVLPADQVTEPFIIATNRRLSVLHPIYKLLYPHYRDTININGLARNALINAGGIIEESFLPGRYSLEMSSAVYKNWVFTDQALPADLIKRGLAVEDPSAPHGLRLVIEDYPYAVDGLEIWDAIKTWVHEYVSLYYPTDDAIKKDSELQEWWKEAVEKGHGDLKDKPWWPKMQTRQELIQSCSTIIWIASALHAAVNFGQYPYGGFILNRPTLSRRWIPEPGTKEYDEMVKSPQTAYLRTITPKRQTIIDLTVIEILSRHASDEIYLGERDNPNWTSDSKALESFKKFGSKLAEIEGKITARNNDSNKKNRYGPVQLPYTLLLPTSEEGLTFRGIPNKSKKVAKMTGGIFGGKGQKIKGTVVLMPKNVLDFNAITSVGKGSAKDTATDFLGKGLDALGHAVDALTAFAGHSISLQLISATQTDGSGKGKVGKEAYLEKHLPTLPTLGARQEAFDINFEWDASFGIPGAFYIKNFMTDEFFLVSVKLEDIPNHGTINFVCNSWVYNFKSYKKNRIFFVNDTYLPSATPGPLVKYRQEELEVLRGDGTGKRRDFDRIYDYDIYNDLGNPDGGDPRPIIGGSSNYPYPRRVRTGREKTRKDPNSEKPGEIYVPRDENFGHLKSSDFLTYGIKSLSQNVIPLFKSIIFDLRVTSSEFDSFDEVRGLFEGGIKLPTNILSQISPLPEIFRTDGENVLQFPPPHVAKVSKSGWMTDEEFAREVIAGVNPNVIRRLQEFPPKSTLDPTLYGDQTSTITKEQLEINMGGVTVEEALSTQRLFILDYQDAFIPYLTRINSLPTAKAYATRTILFLKDDGTLKPLAIELSKPHPDGDNLGPESIVVLPATEGVDSTIWLLAKAHVIVNDSVMEPFAIATNRHLSVLHPIYKLLYPHYRDTININGLARQSLINADGIIEKSFLPGKYSIEMSSSVYKNWVFTDQALPADLVKRGLAIEDPSAPHGLRLVIEDYPYAVDGLEIWDAIKTWVHEYVSLYYPTDAAVQQDTELQAWWKEAVEKGHGDLKEKPWWPKMQTTEDLIQSCSIIVWTASALHAAVNFGQYPYGGLILNRPTLARRFIPAEGTPEYDEMVKNPQKAYLRTITPKFETLIDLSVIEILSRHASDEIYLGERETPNWTTDKKALEAFKRFGSKLTGIEGKINARNSDPSLRNRTGPVQLPYTLLHRSSEEGLTFKGIPNRVAVEDPASPHGLRLLIKDYPYAADGLEIWAAIKSWVQEYVSFYYKSDAAVAQDAELQAFWKELVEVGHGDKKNEPWRGKMKTRQELIDSCTILIWTASALHAAVNFGQYPYGGYILNRPTLSRRFMP